MDTNRIKKIAKEKGVKLKDLAEAIGLTEGGFFQAIKNNSFKVTTIEAIAKYLEIPICLLIVEDEKKNEKEILKQQLDILEKKFNLFSMDLLSLKTRLNT